MSDLAIELKQAVFNNSLHIPHKGVLFTARSIHTMNIPERRISTMPF